MSASAPALRRRSNRRDPADHLFRCHREGTALSSSPFERALVERTGASVEAAVELTVPDLGPSADSATLVSWLKRAGDRVARDEPICRLAVADAQFEVHSTAEGELLRILVPEGRVVAGGESIAEVGVTSFGGEQLPRVGGSDEVPAAPERPEGEPGVAASPPPEELERIEPEPMDPEFVPVDPAPPEPAPPPEPPPPEPPPPEPTPPEPPPPEPSNFRKLSGFPELDPQPPTEHTRRFEPRPAPQSTPPAAPRPPDPPRGA